MARVETFDRNDIIERAMQVFWKMGYNGTSIQDLVDATGLNRSSIYNSFGSKQQLYKLTLEFYEQGSNKNIRKALLQSSNAIEAIRKILELTISSVDKDVSDKGCFILNCKTELGSSDFRLKKWLLNNQENSIALFKELVAEGQDEGLINNAYSSEVYAHSLFCTFQGL
ncbi:MAG: TetR/AcrR family transcriptional regulator, partial [Flavobacteriaceae bacterium]